MKQEKYKQVIKLLKSLLEHGGFIRQSKVRKLSRQQVKLICEICLNIARSNIVLSNEFINQLKEYRLQIKNLTSPKNTLDSKKRTLLSQKGGNLLSFLIPPVLNFLLK
jgi:hypothetical protein